MANKTMTLGETIRKARVDHPLGLRELARAVDKSPSYVTDIEYDRRVPSEAVLRSICEVLHLDFDNLLAMAGRLGEEADQYLRRQPAAGMLMRRVQERDLSDQQLRQLIARVDDLDN